MPLVSIIIPVYRVEPYLRASVDSALRQSFRDFELILVDDGSPDGCGAICDKYALLDPRVRVIHQRNGGLSAARNAGLELASGRYICFLDSDDTVEPELLAKTVPVMEDGADLAVYRFRWVFPDGRQEDCLYGPAAAYSLDGPLEKQRFLLNVLLGEQLGWEACTRIFRRSLIEEHRLRFEDNARIFAEDLCFSLCYCAHAGRVVSLPDCLYHYYRREASIMGSNRMKLNAGRMNELSKTVLGYYRQWDDCRALLTVFPAIHLFILRNVIKRAGWQQKKSLPEIRREAYAEIEDTAFFRQQLTQLLERGQSLQDVLPPRSLQEARNLAAFLLKGNYPAYSLKHHFIRGKYFLLRKLGR